MSPFFSLLSFLRKEVRFHHNLLVPPGSGWGSGVCLPILPYSLFFGSGACLPSSFLFLSSGQGVLFHHDLLVLPGSGWGSGACLPILPYSLFFGSGACLPSSLFFLSSGQGFCSIMICWFLLVPAGVPVLVSLFSLFSLLWFRCLSFPQDRGLFHHDLLVPPGSGWGSAACLSSSLFFGSGACLASSLFFSQEKGSVPSWISWFLLLGAGVPVLVSLLLSSFFSQQECARQLHEF